MRTAAIISYSSYHNAFIDRCIAEAKKCADYVIVMSHDHFYDGQTDTELKEELDCDFSVIPYIPGKPARYYHNELRLAGYYKVAGNFDAYFFIDSDEILEGEKVKAWLEEEAEQGEDYKLAHNWYYRDTCFAANQLEEGAVLVSKETIEDPGMNWWGERERENYSAGWNYMTTYKNEVLGHHYSWAGTKEMLLRKVQSWGHNKDTDWVSMLEQEFTHEFQGCPFRPQYTFKQVEPFVGFKFHG